MKYLMFGLAALATISASLSFLNVLVIPFLILLMILLLLQFARGKEVLNNTGSFIFSFPIIFLFSIFLVNTAFSQNWLRSAFGNLQLLDANFLILSFSILFATLFYSLARDIKIQMVKYFLILASFLTPFIIILPFLGRAVSEDIIWLIMPALFISFNLLVNDYRFTIKDRILFFTTPLLAISVSLYLVGFNSLFLSLMILFGLLICDYRLLKTWLAIDLRGKTVRIFTYISVVLAFFVNVFSRMSGFRLEFFAIEPALRSSLVWEIWQAGLSAKNLVLGTGFGTFEYAFLQFISPDYAQIPQWGLIFFRPSTMFQVLLTEGGLLLLSGILLSLSFIVYKQFYKLKLRRDDFGNAILIGMMSLIIGSLFLPPSFAFWWLLLIFTALLLEGRVYQFSLFANRAFKSIIVLFGFIIISSFVAFYLLPSRFDNLINSYQSVNADNKMILANKTIASIKYLPFSDESHRKLAILSLTELLANKNINDEGRVALLSLAMASAERAVEVDEKSFRNWNTLGEVYSMLIGTVNGAELRAMQAFARAGQLAPGRPDVPVLAGNALVKSYDARLRSGSGVEDNKNLLEEALGLADVALKLRPGFANAILLQVDIYERVGKEMQMIEALKELQKISPRNPQIAYRIGLAYLNSGNSGEAIASLRYATELLPVYSNAWWYLSVALEQQGEFEEAVGALERILSYDGNNQRVSQRISRLKGRNIVPIVEIPEELEMENDIVVNE
jgi:tetratricopeptide (TPR) repeat protein